MILLKAYAILTIQVHCQWKSVSKQIWYVDKHSLWQIEKLLYQIARNFPISYAYATIENEIVRNNKIFFPIYAVFPLSQLSNYTKI